MDSIRVASAQFLLDDNDYNANMSKAREMARRVSQERAVDLMLFCEMCIEGVDISKYEEKLTSSKISQISKFWSDLARECNMHILAGRIDRNDGEWINVASCYAPDGNIIGEYAKTHLYCGERAFMKPGDKRVIISINGWRIGILICADLGFPELSRAYARDGIDMFAVPSCWGDPHTMLWQLCNQMRAAENCCWLVSCNRVGPDISRNLVGGSMAVSPSGEILANLASTTDSYFVSEFKKTCPSPSLPAVSWLEWLRPELY